MINMKRAALFLVVILQLLAISSARSADESLQTEIAVSWVSIRGPEVHVFLKNKTAQPVSFFVGYGALTDANATQCIPHATQSWTDLIPGSHFRGDTLVRASTGIVPPHQATHRVLAFGFPELPPPRECVFRIVVENLSNATQTVVPRRVTLGALFEETPPLRDVESAKKALALTAAVESAPDGVRILRVVANSSYAHPFEISADHRSISCPAGTQGWWANRVGPIDGIATGPYTIRSNNPAAFVRAVETRGKDADRCVATIEFFAFDSVGKETHLTSLRVVLKPTSEFSPFDP